ncbi:MAG TPA: hypothetical protein DHW61_06110 [Lachnoclostridium phytofermentans]|uniref:Uncharacterized protein n=1 Tax=Lachnoclostridium phytofermentans TaxID=66219 RepID=A0A3D2X4B4_9FIRM|nr:signal peptidase II [Lachnoclostridium sp.]HCL01981.1 hypothetical protein [Lachnoclostridium phytofermentans]
MKPIAKKSITIASLVVLDQVIKAIIRHNYFDKNFWILDEIFAFRPKVNTNQSYLGNYVNIFSYPWFAILINVFVIVIVYYIYQYYCFCAKQEKILPKAIYVLLLSGAFCSLIDKIFFGGSLDYILLFDWFIFDLKDCYISGAEVLFAFVAIKNYRVIQKVRIRDITHFCYRRWRKNDIN